MPSKTWRGISDAQEGTGLSCQHRAAWLFCGSWLACDAGTSVCQVHRVDAIAGKPAPTFDRVQTSSTHLPDALRSNCGGGLAREGGGQSAHVSLTYRFREQARSHKLTEFNGKHRTAWLFCGSWLACDAGTSVYQVHRVDAIAGKPAPTS